MFVAYHGVDASTHQQRFDELAGQGLRMTWINVSGDPADARYAAVWVTSDGRGWAGAHNLDAAGYQRRFDELTAAGLVLSVVSASGPADRAVFAALFEQRSVGAWTARHGLTWGGSGQPDTLIGQAEQCQRAGQVPRCLAIYGAPGDERFAGVWWEAIDGVAASMWLGDADFHQRLFDAQVAGGNRPSSLAVSADGRVLSVFRGDQIGAWTARHRIPAQEYQAEFDRQVQQGHRPIVVAAGGSGNDARYAAVFAGDELATPRQWAVTIGRASAPAVDAALDAALADTMRRFGVRSAAIAVARAGDVRVSRGYTWAEPGYAVTQPSALFRQASVSKLFTAAAAQALHDDGVVGLDTPLLDALGAGTPLPVGATVDPRLKQVTLRQAATRLSGMRRDLFGALPGGATGDATMRDVALIASRPGAPSQDDVVRYVTGMPLATNPGTQIGDGYSNIAFFLLGAAVERAAGKSLDVVHPRSSAARVRRQRLRRRAHRRGPAAVRRSVRLRQRGRRTIHAGHVRSLGACHIRRQLRARAVPRCRRLCDVGDDGRALHRQPRGVDLGARAPATRYGDFHGTATIAQSRGERAGCGDRVQLLGAGRGEESVAGSDRTDPRCCDDLRQQCAVRQCREWHDFHSNRSVVRVIAECIDDWMSSATRWPAISTGSSLT